MKRTYHGSCHCKAITFEADIATHSHGRIEAMGGAFLSVHLASLDDLPVSELVSAPLHTMDGLHDNWQNPPAESRHL